MLQRDYVLRLIEQAGAALQRALERDVAGQRRQAIAGLREAQDALLRDLGPAAQHLAPVSLVEIGGVSERDRLRAYARLVAFEARLQAAGGDGISAGLAARRALGMYGALHAAGATFDETDREQLAGLAAELDPGSVPGLDQLLQGL